MTKTIKPKIIIKQIKENNHIIEMVIKDIVKKSGNGGVIILPKELIGKYVEVTYKK